MALAGFEDFDFEDDDAPEQQAPAPAAAAAEVAAPSLPSLAPSLPSLAPSLPSLAPTAPLPGAAGAGAASAAGSLPGRGGDYGWLDEPEPGGGEAEEGDGGDGWADLDRELGLDDDEGAGGGMQPAAAGAGDEEDGGRRSKRPRRQRGGGGGGDESDDFGLDDAGEAGEEEGASPEPEKDRLDDMQVVDAEHTAMVQGLIASMDERQYERFAAFNNAKLQSRPLKKLVTTLTGSDKVDPLLAMALGSVTKAFVGELVERARIIAAHQGHKGALLPGHIRAAYARLEAERRTPHARPLRKPLR
ncbi:hypothetical protein Rsub_12225 [Raphidocelis subcapitata]|uniref:TAFII28-like protein domain-containing protein n=1 Tax=Raphidocelis subcapitata TaxID=307507 RepID=A0A2V0PR99_9CHLO|nr:hypothetical protein Rsub_12225 [Raphidocelis subcapitata]|eukprot:GBF99785.1 hypothetical protein Rsub_12225 [Raphidocelis subcapitata]